MRIREVLAKHPTITAGGQLGPALDLGCGTGLVALALNGLPIGPITGIDLSAGMLQQARLKGLYSELRHCDIMVALTNDEPERWRLIWPRTFLSTLARWRRLWPPSGHGWSRVGGLSFRLRSSVRTPVHGGFTGWAAMPTRAAMCNGHWRKPAFACCSAIINRCDVRRMSPCQAC